MTTRLSTRFFARSLARKLLLVLTISVLANGSAYAQQSAADAERQELLKRIQQLEERLQKLEAEKAAKAPETKSEPEAKAGAKSEPKPEQKPQESTSSGFIDFFKSTEVSGFVDVYYGYNFNKPSGRVNQLRNFDTNSNQFSLNLMEIALEKKPDPSNSRLGYRIDLNYGPATDMVHASEPGGSEIFKHVQQVYGSYLAPIGSGLQIDVGKFVTPHGAEVIETKDNWNYSRSILFAYAIPYYHAGVRVKYAVNNKVSLAGYLVNGWNNFAENNSGKTYGVSVTLTPTPKLSITQNYMTGPEQFENSSIFRHLMDTTVVYTVSPKLALMGNYDYGTDGLAGGGRVHWQGFAGYARFSPTEKIALTPRVEWFDDHDGFTTGLKQRLKEFTITNEYRVHNSLILRLEYRQDFSDQLFFTKSDPLIKARSQSTLLGGLIFTFGTRQ